MRTGKPIPGRPPISLAVRFWRTVEKTDSCWNWTGETTTHNRVNYGRCRIKENGVWHKRVAHRVGWILQEGPIPEGMQVLHRCDNPLCVRRSHLFLGDHDINMADKAAKGRAPAGANHTRTVMHPQLTAYIRRLASDGLSYTEIATYTELSRTSVGRITRGESWC